VKNSMTPQGGFTRGYQTATADTLINCLVPPKEGLYTRITTLVYTSGTTAHTLTVLRALGKTYLAAEAAASQAVLTLREQPVSGNSVAANDYLVWQNTDGSYTFGLVSSASGLTITMGSSLSKAAAAGRPVWMMGVLADTHPKDGFAHPQLRGVASTRVTWADDVAGVVQSVGANEPLLVQSNNATAAGHLEQVSGAYTVY
jgi:hypothetical protein